MSYADRYDRLDEPRAPNPQWKPSHWMVLAFFVALAVICVGTYLGRRRYDGARIAAGPFRWPDGCSPRRYRPGDRLPEPCFDRFQKISSKWASAHHLRVRQGRRSYYNYYRIGNDAVSPLCLVWQDSCTIGWAYRGLFVVDESISGETSADWRTVAPAKRSKPSHAASARSSQLTSAASDGSSTKRG